MDAARQNSLRAGLTWERFYQYTPFQTAQYVRAWIKTREDETEIAMLAAFHTANLTLYVNDPEKFPSSFEEWFSKGKPKKPQTEEEASAAILFWARNNGLKEL